MTPTPAEASTLSEIYELLRYQRSTGSRLRRSMTHNLDCFALLSGDESQAGAMSSAISSEEGVTVSSRWRQWVAVSGVAWPWRDSAMYGCAPVLWHAEPRAERQTCIDEVDFDIDAQPDDDPQNGQ